MDTTFSRIMLKGVTEDVRKLITPEQAKEAWVWTSDRRTWEFHFGEYFQCFGASDAYEAKAKGWRLWLTREEGRSKAEVTIEKACLKAIHDFETGPWDCHDLGVCIVTYESRLEKLRDGYGTVPVKGDAKFYFEWFDRAFKLREAEQELEAQ